MSKRALRWVWTLWPLRNAQPTAVGLLGLPLPIPGLGLFSMLKMGAAAGAGVFLGYQAGLWIGDGRGYDRRTVEFRQEIDVANVRIDRLNETLELERIGAIANRENASTAVAKSLKDIPVSTRFQCAQNCSLPADTRAALQEID